MSEPTPRPASPAHPTRQQLDELEALMQRMLALPVNQSADPGEALDVPDVAPEIAVFDNAEVRLANTWEQPAATLTAPTPSEPTPPAPRVPEPTVSAHHSVVAPRLRKPAEGKLRGRRLAATMMLTPLLWTNRAFDQCAARLGRPGRWLSGPSGRSTLGWLGVVCLLAALAWVIIELNWTW